MRWKTLLILSLSAILLLFLSYRVGEHLLKKAAPPPFAMLDSYLRTSAATGDWKLESHTHKAYGAHKPGLWNRIGLRLYLHYDQDNYLFQNTLTTEVLLVSVWREKGKLVNYHFSGSSVPAEALKDTILRKYPRLADSRYKP